MKDSIISDCTQSKPTKALSVIKRERSPHLGLAGLQRLRQRHHRLRLAPLQHGREDGQRHGHAAGRGLSAKRPAFALKAQSFHRSWVEMQEIRVRLMTTKMSNSQSNTELYIALPSHVNAVFSSFMASNHVLMHCVTLGMI
eukprot:scaffold214983_cov33-Prasinocladus_malaysianus.AAC.1